MNKDKLEESGSGILAGLFRKTEDGERALAEFKSAGFNRVELSSVASSQTRDDASGTTRGAYDEAPAGTSAGTSRATAPFFQEHDSSASSFARELEQLGFSKRDAHDLVEGVVGGQALVTVDAAANGDGAAGIMNRYHADVRYAGGGSRLGGASAAPLAGAAVAATAATAGSGVADEDRELQLRAERLVVNKERVQHGEVRVRKVVVDEMKSIDVPVRREELVIERHAATGAGATSAATGPIEAETIRIPLSEEQVNVSKQTVVREEVEIGKRRVEETQHVTETLQHEELRVDDGTTTKRSNL